MKPQESLDLLEAYGIVSPVSARQPQSGPNAAASLLDIRVLDARWWKYSDSWTEETATCCSTTVNSASLAKLLGTSAAQKWWKACWDSVWSSKAPVEFKFQHVDHQISSDIISFSQNMRGTSVNNSVPSCQNLPGPPRKPSQRCSVFWCFIKMVHSSAAVHWGDACPTMDKQNCEDIKSFVPDQLLPCSNHGHPWSVGICLSFTSRLMVRGHSTTCQVTSPGGTQRSASPPQA